MRHLLTAASVAALMVLSVIPASAGEDGPVRLDPCVTSNTVLMPGTPVAETVDGPTIMDGQTSLTFTLDLSGQTVADDKDMKTVGKVDAGLSWLVAANDYDLDLNGVATEGYQPVDPATEFTSVTNVAHCSTVTVSVVNFLATGLDPVDVSVSARL